MSDFYKKLKKPFFVLAPMEDVTDFAFREMFARYAKPDVLYTEFTSSDGLVSEGRINMEKDLLYSEKQRPVVAQLFTSKPENMRKSCLIVKELGFDGIDINMGCPDKSIEKQNCGADLIKNPQKAIELIEAASSVGLPLSVKTRLGYNTTEIDTWIKTILQQKIKALTIHLRTRKEMSKVPADWEHMKKIKEMRDEISPETLIIGNGDVLDIDQAKKLADKYKCDGIMIGRGAYGNPWFFSGYMPTVTKKLNVLIEHTELFIKTFGKTKSFNVMKKHYKAYVNGFRGAKELRIKLMESKEIKDIKKHIADFCSENEDLA